MNHRYQVKFEWQGQTCYGLVNQYSDDAKDAAKRGHLLIEDAVLPVCYEVKDDDKVIDIPMEPGRYDFGNDMFVGSDEYHTYVQQQYKAAKQRSESLEGVQRGKLFSIGVADGRAWYMITKVGRSKCTVEWRGFALDRYYDHHFQSGGQFPINDIARYVARADGMRKLFGKKGKPNVD